MNKRLDVLVLHGIRDLAKERRTSVRHMFALQRYSPDHRFVYHYVEDPITEPLRSIPFGAIVLDCTFLCWRWARPRQLFNNIKERYDAWLRSYGAFVMAFPQDDFDHSTYLDDWLADIGTNIVLCVYRQNTDILYPRLVAQKTEIVPALAGYIDEDELAEYRAARRPFRQRSIDVAYRVRRLPANFGRLGILKSDFGRAFASRAGERARCDISDTPKDFIYGDAWLRFLGDTRFTLGSEGGSSVLDPVGEVKDRVEAFVAEHPEASFDDIASACLKPQDEKWDFPALSPRIFESAMAGNCPILIEGSYEGLIAPEEHFIPVKSDFSDIGSAVDRLADLDGAERMAARFEEKILGDPTLRYKTWVKTVIEPRLLDKGVARSDRLSDWEFAFRLEQHHNALVAARVREINDVKEEMRVRLDSECQRLESRPLWRVIGSRVKAKLFPR